MITFDADIRYPKRLKVLVSSLVVELLRSRQSVVLESRANTTAGLHWFRALLAEASTHHVLPILRTSDEVVRVVLSAAEEAEGCNGWMHAMETTIDKPCRRYHALSRCRTSATNLLILDAPRGGHLDKHSLLAAPECAESCGSKN